MGGKLFDADLQYIGTTVNNANQTNYTFSGVSIGDASDDRVVIVGSAHNFGCTEISVGGTPTTLVDVGNIGLGYIAIPSGTTATIVVSTNGGTNQNCRIWVYTAQSRSGVPLFHGGTNSGDASSIEIPDVETRPNGGIAVIGQFNDDGGFTLTWDGAETFVNNQNGLSETSVRQFSSSFDSEAFTTSGNITCTRLSDTSAMRIAAISF